jgi:microcin C transport system substrate-binding protein
LPNRLFFSRRSFLQLSAGGLFLPSFISRRAVAAVEEVEVHGLSVFGDLAEKPDFKAFGYVNIAAPKGGAVSRDMLGTFNSLNAFILRGDPAFGMEFVFDSLLKGSLDEHDALYGLVARAIRISPDKLTYRFLLRKEARFHDGTPLTAKDVTFSLDTLKSKGHPMFRLQLRDMVSAMPEADDILVVTFAAGRSRQLPLFVAGSSAIPHFNGEYAG